MRWKVVFDRGAYKEILWRRIAPPPLVEFIMVESVEAGVVQKILDDLKGLAEPHYLWIYSKYYHVTVISRANYKRREIAICDVKRGDKR